MPLAPFLTYPLQLSLSTLIESMSSLYQITISLTVDKKKYNLTYSKHANMLYKHTNTDTIPVIIRGTPEH